MNDAACSWRTSTYRIGDRARASTNSMFSSPGMPKTVVTPSRSRQRQQIRDTKLLGHHESLPPDSTR
jgi:hypothetical protein